MSHGPYDPHLIEPQWQQFWLSEKSFCSTEDPLRPKYYILDMFPYPSGSGLHVGHLVGYVATDVVARYQRMQGKSVLHPMGWDSFGLPAEQYAIRTGTHPAVTTQRNIDTYRRQLQSVGLSYDWDRELATSDPDYYRWTQWIFTKLYEKGLAYEAEVIVNYCPALGTVLANEEVVDGRSIEGGHPVERRPLRQWMLRITAYADRLLEDLTLLDWPESLKKLQTNWIGRSEGAEIDFTVEGDQGRLRVYTTRPDTLGGVTYLVLAPEHPLVASLTTAEQRAKVEQYQAEAASQEEQQRLDPARPKTGVWTGSFALHPITQAQVPIWIADYVLASVGTGVVMGVPAHDARDFLFAQQHGLLIRCVIEPSIESLEAEGLLEPEQALTRIVAGLDCWPGEGVVRHSSGAGLAIDGCSSAEARKRVVSWLQATSQGSPAVHYKLRDWLFSRQRYWGEPFPILHLEGGEHRILSLDELPLIPPHLTDYRPPEGELSPLAAAQQWVFITDPKTGRPARRELNTMPQWAGSCWYYLRFLDPHNQQEAWSEASEQYWMPVDLYVGGAEHAVLHLLYARFWHKVLFDCGLVHTPEPFQTYRYQGLVLARSYRTPDGLYVDPDQVVLDDELYRHQETGSPLTSQIEKMSKSKLNGVSPDDVIAEYGADAVRLYALFIGPFDKEKVWNNENIAGCRRFLNRVWEMGDPKRICAESQTIALRLVHRLVAQVTEDIEQMHFNTAVAKFMETSHQLNALGKVSRKAWEMFLLALAPFAPHLTEELWRRLGHDTPLAGAAWPAVDPALCIDETVQVVVQVDGKHRATLCLARDVPKELVEAAALADPQVLRHLPLPARKVIYLPNKLINFVT